MSRLLVLFGVVAATILVSVSAVAWLPQTLTFPEYIYVPAEGLKLHFIQAGRNEAECEVAISKLRQLLTRNCANCELSARCVSGLDDARRLWLSDVPIDVPSLRLPDGVVLVSAIVSKDALAVCKQSETTLQAQAAGIRARCYEPGVSRHDVD